MKSTMLNTADAAFYIGVSKAYLERDRWAGAKVPYLKIGLRAVRYRLSDLDDFLDSCARSSTSDPRNLK